MLWAIRKLGRKLTRPRRPGPTAAPPPPDPTLADRKAAKLARLRPLLRADLPVTESAAGFDFLTPELRAEFHIADTANVSRNEYDPFALELIGRFRNGWVLDCGAGCRPVYYDNVVNFEICDYPSTDVRGVGERLPFRDGVFDAVLSLAVLEHVRRPWECAAEIARVLKPGGELYCVVPFLQPLHGYPHHYFNMSHQGLRSLFEPALAVTKQEVIGSGLPVWAAAWHLSRWAASLPPLERVRFLSLRVSDLIADPVAQLGRGYVTALSAEANLELASTTALFARKPG